MQTSATNTTNTTTPGRKLSLDAVMPQVYEEILGTVMDARNAERSETVWTKQNTVTL